MDPTTVFVTFIALGLVAAVRSLINGYMEMARIEGMHAATVEIMRGVESYYQLEGQNVPNHIRGIMKRITLKSSVASVNAKDLDDYRKQFWELGRALGERHEESRHV